MNNFCFAMVHWYRDVTCVIRACGRCIIREMSTRSRNDFVAQNDSSNITMGFTERGEDLPFRFWFLFLYLLRQSQDQY
jgi:hypothetical protein